MACIDRFNQNLKQFLSDNIENNLNLLNTACEDYNSIIEEKEELQNILFETFNTEQVELFDRFYDNLMEADSIKINFLYFQGIKDCLKLGKVLAVETAENKEFMKVFL